MKKVRIICDRCGKQYFNKIPRTCRVCGEELYFRMPLEYRMLVKEKIAQAKEPYAEKLALSYVFFTALIIIATILSAQNLGSQMQIALVLVGSLYVLSSPFFLPTPLSGHPFAQFFVFFFFMLCTGIAASEIHGKMWKGVSTEYYHYAVGVLFLMAAAAFIFNIITRSVAAAVVGKIKFTSDPAELVKKKYRRVYSRKIIRNIMRAKKMKMFTLIPHARPLDNEVGLSPLTIRVRKA